jgi:CPA2 family monovalent cation:H+ antiporter-2
VAALARCSAPAGVALRTGLYLAQAGEFGFVLLSLGAGTGWSPALAEPGAGGMVLSMLATPFSSCTATAS